MGASITAATLATHSAALGLAAGSAAAAWLTRRRATRPAELSTAWFHASSAPEDFFTAAQPVQVNPKRLLDGLGAQAHHRWLKIAQITQASHLGSLHSTLIGVDPCLARHMSISAAGCGIRAVPAVRTTPSGNIRTFTDTGTAAHSGTHIPQLRIGTVPPWILGMDMHGDVIAIHPIAGATIVVLGFTGEPPSHPWLRSITAHDDGTLSAAGGNVTAQGVTGDSAAGQSTAEQYDAAQYDAGQYDAGQANNGIDASWPDHHSHGSASEDSDQHSDAEQRKSLLQAYRQAWNPNYCRLVLLPSGSDYQGIHSNLSITYSSGSSDAQAVIHHNQSGYSTTFWPLDLQRH